MAWIFKTKPVIKAASAVGGPFEAKGPLASSFDQFFDKLDGGEGSFEKAQRRLMEDASVHAMKKAELKNAEVDVFLAGDLINQMTPTNFAARTLSIPFIGLYNACATSMAGFMTGAALIDGGYAKHVLTAAASHHSAVEKQFRYPTEYGGQKPPVSQWTATACGAAILSLSGEGPYIHSASPGRVIDYGIKDPYNMGSAMAPAAADTIIRHVQEPHEYDCIITGDLGRIGKQIAIKLLKESGMNLSQTSVLDCGELLYGSEPQVFSGGSGAGCSAAVTCGHIYQKMKAGEWSRVLIAATGALLSPLSVLQKDSIPCIAHAVELRRF
ncbi:stage V sporulation protein AD [Domibacillus epiphyticus]|uniref:Stage V sporulation protein AD n=1 Tax=Domibacillus epiphyticus TaxID=1714355 RepID=A0A1V2A8R5_9BACI|nr:stage V sporulation protein AD [Domibacillus epiphyticus]OMP67252.1 stage V sporulation protein AD [Domibacillus epiphyticus]